jgi:hypothetical protein
MEIEMMSRCSLLRLVAPTGGVLPLSFTVDRGQSGAIEMRRTKCRCKAIEMLVHEGD